MTRIFCVCAHRQTDTQEELRDPMDSSYIRLKNHIRDFSVDSLD